MAKQHLLTARRLKRTRYQIKQNSSGRPRLSVFRSEKHIYAQIIDDVSGRTIAAASSIDKAVKADLKNGAGTEAAKSVGKLIAERAGEKGIKQVVFDRGDRKSVV